MSKISNINQLRDFTLETLDKLVERSINIKEATAIAMLCDNVLNTVKTEMIYAKMTKIEPTIKFMKDENNLLEHAV